MIEKIIEISNVGHFVDFKFHGSKLWNGQLKKLNIVYAPNGSGKTTLSTILKSLSQNDIELIKFKKTFGSKSAPKVIIKEYGKNSLITLGESLWSSNNLKIEVFDINYIEEYLFTGSFHRKQNKTNLFKLLLGKTGQEYRNKMKRLINRKEDLRKQKVHLSKDSLKKESLKLVETKLDLILKEFETYATPIYDRHIELVNKYLAKFTSYISLTEFSNDQSTDFERFRIFPVFEVYDEEVVFSNPSRKHQGHARYSMSEGDKSTIALCFFLARLEILGVSDKIIVFDDPLSSFDYSRRNATIHYLAKIADSAVQFILLTHDLGFAADFSDKCSFIDHVTLKIENDTNTSFLTGHDIHAEFLTSIQKDIKVVKKFLTSGAKSEYARREVIRCIRPVLEGVFKSKYFDLIANNLWLGDIIELIRKSEPGNRLNRLKALLDEVIELNDYTKRYHHASSDNRQNVIDPAELRRYVQILMQTIDKV